MSVLFRAAVIALAASLVGWVADAPAVNKSERSRLERPNPSIDRPATDAVAISAGARRASRARKLRGHESSDGSALLAAIPRNLPVTTRPGGGKRVGLMPATSPTFKFPLVAWILDLSSNGRHGKVPIPYSGTRATGWIPIERLQLSRTPYRVQVDLSRHTISVTRADKVIMKFPVGTGAPQTPTPPGDYFVTDLVQFNPGGPLGSFAFGISGTQPRLPAGWTGADQLAIHGTPDPSSIGKSVSTGCLRVSDEALRKLKPLVTLGTPVVVRP